MVLFACLVCGVTGFLAGYAWGYDDRRNMF